MTTLPDPTAPIQATATPIKIGWKRVLADPKFVGACIAFVTLLGSAFIMGAGASPAEKLQFFKTAVYAAAAIYAAALGALGYETGKLFEGVTPAGFVPTVPTIAAVAAPLRSAAFVDVLKTPGEIPAAEAIQLGPDGAEPVRRSAAKDMRSPLWLFLALSAALLCMGSGCASTSAQFKATIPAGVSNVVQDMRDYTAHNDFDVNHDGTTDATEAAAKTAEVQKTDTLAASVADKANIKTSAVKSAWEAVKPIWMGYVANDPTLSDPKMRDNVLRTGPDIDALIKVEEERENVIKNLFSGLGIGS